MFTFGAQMRSFGAVLSVLAVGASALQIRVICCRLLAGGLWLVNNRRPVPTKAKDAGSLAQRPRLYHRHVPGLAWHVLAGRRTVDASVILRCWFQQAFWHGYAGDGCRTIVDSEFAVGVLEVLGNGPRADLQGMGNGGVGAAVSDESQDLDLALGQSGKPVGGHRGKRLPGLLTSAGLVQGGVQRGLQHAKQGAILIGEVVAAPVHCDADDLVFGAGQADGHLIFDGYAAEELGVEAEAVESLLGEKVADHYRLPAAGGTVVVDQWVFVDMGCEHRLGRRVEGTAG